MRPPDTYLLQCASCGLERRIGHGCTDVSPPCPSCGAPTIAAHCVPTHVTEAEWEAEMALSKSPAIVVVQSRTCSTCAAYESSARLMAPRFYGQARVLFIDIDESPSIAAGYGVAGVPTVLLFREGNLLASLPGPRGEQGLRERLGIE